MARAFVFPGQGSQAIGMGRELAAAFPAAQAVFQEVDGALNQSLFRLMQDGPESELTLTENAQPALMAMGLATLRVIEQESGRTLPELCRFVAGHSLGEYSALAAAGALDLSDTARLLKLRGQAMQKAVAVDTGAMAALLGAEVEQAVEVCAAAAAGEVVEVANDNGGGQVVISGHKTAVARAVELAKSKGIKRAMMLSVSAPFHCALMRPAAEAMQVALDRVAIVPPQVPVVANVTAEPVSDPARIKSLLVQ
ncbi:MAG TPA: ACP S-malonyltransferase, partial [Vineibacter sp.]|nr:ACP S-malonyltransferase [Vineibacter sp.]